MDFESKIYFIQGSSAERRILKMTKLLNSTAPLLLVEKKLNKVNTFFIRYFFPHDIDPLAVRKFMDQW